MGWRDNLLPASFRGVPFFYFDAEHEGGREPVDHQFPLRNTNYAEDIGSKTASYRIQAYVLGDNYFAERDALIAALCVPGTGTLVHPYRGSLTVQAKPFRCKETRDEGGMASFDLEFIDAGTQPSPTSAIDTAGATGAASGAMGNQLQSSFGLDYATDGYPSGVSTAASALVSGASVALGALLGTAGVTTALSAPFLATLAGTTIDDAAGIAGAITGLCSAYATDVANSQATFDDTLSSRGPTPIADPTYGLGLLSAWGSTLPPVSSLTPVLQQRADNQAAMVALVQGAAVNALAALFANCDFASTTDAESARDNITGLIDNLAVTAADARDDAAWQAWQALYAASATDLSTRGKQLPNIIAWQFGTNLPALMLAERFYQDASRAGELVARNNAPHPLFLPLSVEALSR